MKKWFTVKTKYNKTIITQDGEDSKRVSETFLIPAVSFTDAELRINKEIGQTKNSELSVQAMSVTEITDIFRSNNDEGDWWLCKIVILPEVEEGEKPAAKIKQSYMVEANSVNSASTRVAEKLNDAMFTYEITNIALSLIVNVFHQDLDVEISRETVDYKKSF